MDAVRKSVETVMKSLGTAWVDVGTPNLTGGDGGQAEGVADAEGAQQITQVLGYVTWISLVIAILSLVALGALIATRQRSGDGIAASSPVQEPSSPGCCRAGRRTAAAPPSSCSLICGGTWRQAPCCR